MPVQALRQLGKAPGIFQERLKPQITKDEMAIVNKRLKSLGGVRASLPKGVDPTRARMDRKALRGK